MNNTDFEDDVAELRKIISGGQAGVDRAALDAATEVGLKRGGWCPQGRKAEDGTIPADYPVIELPGAGYQERTRQNVADSDGTVIIYYGAPAGGTELTLLFCLELSKPCLLVDADEFPVEGAAVKVVRFVDDNDISVLNVAGPRASEAPSAYRYTHEVLLRAFPKTRNR